MKSWSLSARMAVAVMIGAAAGAGSVTAISGRYMLVSRQGSMLRMDRWTGRTWTMHSRFNGEIYWQECSTQIGAESQAKAATAKQLTPEQKAFWDQLPVVEE